MPKYNILFLIMPTVGKEYEEAERYKTCVLPYGVLSLATYLKSKSTKVNQVYVLDLCVERNSGYLKNPSLLNAYLKEYNIDIVGISAMFSGSLSYLEDFSKEIKMYSESVFCFTGGVAASNQYKRVLTNIPFIDAVCIGEGELPIFELVESEIAQDVLKQHPSWVTEADCGVKMVNSTYITNLDEIPFLEYDLVNVNDYKGRLWDEEGTTTFPMHATRGCPFNCIFCCAANNHGKRIRYVSASRFVEDATKIVEEYGAKVISIDDDQFLLNQSHAKEILRGLSKLETRLEFPSGLSVRYIDEEIVELMAKCGVKEIPLAIESGSPRMLKEIIDKPLNLEEIQPVVERLRKNGILVKAFFVIGIPGETPEDRRLTWKLMRDVGFDWNNIAIAMPLPGSRLFDVCVKNNYITQGENIELLPDIATITAPHIQPEEIKEIAYMMNLDVNFINNHALRSGNGILAEEQFYHIVTRYPFHALGHWCYAKALEMNHRESELIDKHMKLFYDLIESNQQWKKYAERFGLIEGEKI